ncbi:MAG: cyclic nucleotide-binding domain-containing protein [Alphaproteobacteria bacterium]|nr:cyclic nucleotide-binding domain-containing protein [Alphaproteobacteria bacterium]
MSSASGEVREAMTRIGAFGAMSGADMERLVPFGRLRTVARGEALMRAGEDATTLYFVVDGRFAVMREGGVKRVGEIGRGEPVGEIAFFRGGRRTADVMAIRNGLVLGFERSQLEDVMKSVPHFASLILESLATRLAHATPHVSSYEAHVHSGSFAISGAGAHPAPAEFVKQLAHALGVHGSVRLFDSASLRQSFGEWAAASANDVISFIEARERETRFCLFECDGLPHELAHHVLKACDGLVFAARASAEPCLSDLESFAQAECAGAPVRLVLIHPHSGPYYHGTARWLENRSLQMHHHTGEDSPAGMARLARFIAGCASGLAASGGGAACAAQIGVYRAFREAGVRFDYLCGTSGGAAMAAAFAHDLEPEDIEHRLHDMFITRRALSKYTLPRYSLIDHRPFDDALRAHYGETDIEDLAQPFFAVSTNLSTGSEHLHLRGPLWQAIRASGAIPGLLPPFYTANGDMLVDGCLVDNLPVARLRRLKSGPNVAIALRPAGCRSFDVDYEALPGGWQVASSFISGLAGVASERAPSIAEVLTLSLTLSRDMHLPAGGGGDLLFRPPIPDGMAYTQWNRYRELSEAGWRYSRARIAELAAAGEPVLSSLLRGS